MNHKTGKTAFDTSINQQTSTDILEQNKVFVRQYNIKINIAKDKYSKKKITEKYNNNWNNQLIKKL